MLIFIIIKLGKFLRKYLKMKKKYSRRKKILGQHKTKSSVIDPIKLWVGRLARKEKKSNHALLSPKKKSWTGGWKFFPIMLNI
jgi:hypothetical protein